MRGAHASAAVEAASPPKHRVGRALGCLLLAAGLLGAAGPAEAAPERQVVLVVVPELSYERALADPFLAKLAEGIGLLTTSGGADVPARTALAIGAGRPVPEAPGPPRVGLVGEGLQVDLAAIVERLGEGDVGLLGSTLAEAGLTVGYADPRMGGNGVAEPAALAAMDASGRTPLAWLAYARTWTDAGASEADVLAADVVVGPSLDLVRPVLERTDAVEVLVIVAGAGASPAMRERGETVNTIALARGTPEELLDPDGPIRGLTSETTRRGGVVAEVDVAPTILDFLGVRTPPRMVGSPIRIEGDPPTALHRRFLELQRVVGPAGLAGVSFGLAVLAACLALLFAPGGARRSRRVARGVVIACSLLIAMLPTSWLPSFTPGKVALALGATTAAIAGVALLRGRGDVRRALATVGAIGLVLVGIDALLGWPSELTPMLGGGVLDGERFFGLGNAYAGIVLSGALLAAAGLRPRTGVLLLVSAAILAGLPSVGADLGGSLTLVAAAALWIGLPRWGLRPRTWVLVATAMALDAASVTIAGRVLDGGPTHLSRLASEDGVLVAFVVRLLANVRTTSATPAAWLMLVGLGVWAVLALRPPAVLRPALEADPRWRLAVLALAICGLLGWAVNDTYGLAGGAFTFASAALLAPALAPERITR